MTNTQAARASQAKKVADAALRNEEITRERVGELEKWAQSFSGMNFVERLRWLVLGRGR